MIPDISGIIIKSIVAYFFVGHPVYRVSRRRLDIQQASDSSFSSDVLIIRT